MSIPHKMHVKLGADEFQAEGAQDVVNKQYLMFLELAKSKSQVASTPPPPPPPPKLNGNGAGAAVGELSKELLHRVFLVDPEGQVSLRILPKSQQRDAEGLIVLLYGFRILGNQMDVLSGRLLQAAQTSGLSVERADRTIIPFQEYVTKGGTRSGSRWGLNNRGVTKAEEIIQGMLN